MTLRATPPAAGDTLQFDQIAPASSGAGAPDVDGTAPTVACSSCRTTVAEYYTLESEPLCTACRDAVVRQAAPVREWSLVARAVLLGLGAAVAGAVVYYGVIAITEFEIGIVAILIGYMVGWAVRKGARGRGGRRLQVAAIALTYLSVSLAYLPLAIKGAMDAEGSSGAAAQAAGDSTAAHTDTRGRSAAPGASLTSSDTVASSATVGADSASAMGLGGAFLGIGMLLAFALALPVMVVFGSLPSGLLSAIIIGIGMQQAWKMTGAPALSLHGPYRVGAGVAPERATAEGTMSEGTMSEGTMSEGTMSEGTTAEAASPA